MSEPGRPEGPQVRTVVIMGIIAFALLVGAFLVVRLTSR